MNMEINKEKSILLDLEGTHYLSVQCQNPKISRLKSWCVMQGTYPMCLVCTLGAFMEDHCSDNTTDLK